MSQSNSPSVDQVQERYHRFVESFLVQYAEAGHPHFVVEAYSQILQRGIEAVSYVDDLMSLYGGYDRRQFLYDLFTSEEFRALPHPEKTLAGLSDPLPVRPRRPPIAELEQYQDIWVKGEVEKRGVRECEDRFELIRDFCSQYTRPFTILDIGSNLGYFSLRLTEVFDCTAVAVEGIYGDWTHEVLRKNENRKVILLQKVMSLDDLRSLAEVEHFDVVLALSVIHHLEGSFDESLRVLRSLGDHLILELPYEANACGQGVVNEVINAQLPEEMQLLGYGKSHLMEGKRKIVLLSQPKRSLTRSYLGTPRTELHLSITSTFDQKKVRFHSKEEERDWVRGINLQTYLWFNGVYPARQFIAGLLERNGIPGGIHRDIQPWNVVLKGDEVELIDRDDINHIYDFPDEKCFNRLLWLLRAEPSTGPGGNSLPESLHISEKPLWRHNRNATVVGVDARTFYYPDSVTRGIGHYSLNHLLHAAQLKPDWKFILYGESEEVPEVLKKLVALPNVTMKPVDEYRAAEVDILHICDPMNLLGGFDSPYRIFKAPRATVTFYDLIPLRLYFPTMDESFRFSYHQRLKQLNRSGATALAISDYTKRDLVGSIVLPPERVEVIMAGLNHSAPHGPVTPEKITEVKSRLGITKPYFLHVGALDPHKNFTTSLSAFQQCSKTSSCQLVVVGRMEHYIKAYAGYVKEHRIRNVIFTDFISREDLEILYRDAIALLFMSIYEGFGFPVLEAMAQGCPVITSNGTSIPEVAGDAASTLPPKDIDALVKEMTSLLTDGAKRETMRKRGLERSREFTWDRTAGKTITVWEKMLGAENISVVRAPANDEVESGKDDRTPVVSPSPVRLLYHSPIFDPSGYADEGRGFILHLDRRGIDVAAAEIGRRSEQFRNALDPSVRGRLDELLGKKALSGCISIMHFPGYAFQPRADAAYNVGRTMFETDSLPDEWVAKCNRMDEVWVPSEFNMETFRKAGVTTRLFRVPSGIDTGLYKPGITPRAIPGAHGKVFLSMFEWSYRKGWDVLLRSWAEAFDRTDDVTLVLRTYPVNATDAQNTRQVIESRIDAFLKSQLQRRRKDLADIVVLGEQIPEREMPEFFAAGTAYVAPSRGEGWGRPQMAAMACGLPVIATRWSGNMEFMNDENSLLIDLVSLEEIGERSELPFYRGQRWAEPSVQHCSYLMRFVCGNAEHVKNIGTRARKDMEERWDWKYVSQIAENRLREIHAELAAPHRKKEPVAIVWEGAQFANHSLSMVNREFSRLLVNTGHEVSLQLFGKSDFQPEREGPYGALLQCANKGLANTDIHVRHHWPPNLAVPESGRWVVMQPWEFGSLPKDWVRAFYSGADEVWAYTNYVRQVYVESGIPAERVHVVPLGVDPAIFHPGVKPYRLKTKKKFRFLFVGGTIPRKGIDLLLDAYTHVFTRQDDVCLVIKDMGGESFYAGQTFRKTILDLMKRQDSPEIEYIDRFLKDEELAGLYTACNVLVHPYRGEGFGLPVLEAMACGIPPIVTNGGACLDFCNDSNSLLVKAARKRFAEKKIGEYETVNYPWMYEVDPLELEHVMLRAHKDPAQLKAVGNQASAYVRDHWTWEKSFERLLSRVEALNTKPVFRTSVALALRQLEETIVVAGRLFGEQRYSDALFHMSLVEDIVRRQIPEEERAHITAEVENFKGDCYLQLHDAETSKACYERALQANPDSSRACAGIGEVLYRCGLAAHAKTMFEWAVKNDPTSGGAVEGLAKANNALQLPHDHNTLCSGDAERLLGLAVDQYMKSDFVASLQTALDIEAAFVAQENGGTDAEMRGAVLNLQGACHLGLADLEAARLAFERALNINPVSSQACAGLGEVFSASGLYQHAKTMYEWAVKNDPENRKALQSLGRVNAALGLPEEDNSLLAPAEEVA